MQENKQAMPFAKSLISVTLTVILASITHAYEFGYRAFVAVVIVVALLYALNILYRRTKNKASLVFYGLLNAWIIIGFGLINGFWNHTFKAFLSYLHGGYLPPFLAGLFMKPQIGSFLYEGIGTLTFVSSVFAAYMDLN